MMIVMMNRIRSGFQWSEGGWEVLNRQQIVLNGGRRRGGRRLKRCWKKEEEEMDKMDSRWWRRRIRRRRMQDDCVWWFGVVCVVGVLEVRVATHLRPQGVCLCHSATWKFRIRLNLTSLSIVLQIVITQIRLHLTILNCPPLHLILLSIVLGFFITQMRSTIVNCPPHAGHHYNPSLPANKCHCESIHELWINSKLTTLH